MSEEEKKGRNRRNSEEEPQEETSLGKEILSWLQIIVAAVVIAFVLNNFVIANSRIPTGSMENTIMSHSRVIGSRLSYIKDDPERGDIVIFRYPDNEKLYYVKRVIGLPGETVQVIDGYAYIDGQQLTSDIYGAEIMDSPGIAAEPITLGEDEYFLLGDNRNHSSDSRDPSVGILHREDLIGKAWVRIYPFDKMGVIRHE